MFSSFFRRAPVAVAAATVSEAPTSREILEHNNRCLDTYRQIIDLNKQIAADLKENTRLLMSAMPRQTHVQIRTCPSSHSLVQYTAIGGSCDVCNRIVFVGQQVMDCRACNWYMCERCARTNGFTLTPPPPTTTHDMYNLMNQLFPQTTATAQTELYTFDVPLNGQGFDEFVAQLTQSLNQIAPTGQEDVVITPTTEQIDQACCVMPAIEANRSAEFLCPIDLSPVSSDENVMIIKHCGHAFRESNLRELFRRDVKCPLCRFDIRDHVMVTNDSESEDDDIRGTFD
jgi:hypothetical protein